MLQRQMYVLHTYVRIPHWYHSKKRLNSWMKSHFCMTVSIASLAHFRTEKKNGKWLFRITLITFSHYHLHQRWLCVEHNQIKIFPSRFLYFCCGKWIVLLSSLHVLHALFQPFRRWNLHGWNISKIALIRWYYLSDALAILHYFAQMNLHWIKFSFYLSYCTVLWICWEK